LLSFSYPVIAMDNKFNDDSNPPLFSNNENAFQDFEFDSFGDFDDVGATTLNNNDVSSINVEEYAFQELDLDAKYRSIQAVNPDSFTAFAPPALNSMAPPSLSKTSSSPFHTNSNHLLTKAPPVIVTATTKPVVVPEKPFYVAVTQFISVHNIDTVISMINYDLSSVLEISYEFYHDKCRVSWCLCHTLS
jgi:hypothetical protein